jgi:hypothetical protein
LQLLSAVTAVLENAHITHWISKGTLLGAVRDAQLLPWSNDVDVSFFHEDLPAVLDAMRTLQQAGLFVRVKRTKAVSCAVSPSECGGLDSDDHADVPHLGRPSSDQSYIEVNPGVLGVHLDLNGRSLAGPVTDPATVLRMTCHPGIVRALADGGFDEETGMSRIEVLPGMGVASPIGTTSCEDLTSKGHVRVSHILPLSSIELEGRHFWAPGEREAVLLRSFGPGWRTPVRGDDFRLEDGYVEAPDASHRDGWPKAPEYASTEVL